MATVPKARALNCPNCGGSVEVRGFGQALNAVCVQCLAILDAKSPEVRILQTVDQKTKRWQPYIPLGARGQLHGATYECIGFQVRQIVVDGEAYHWSEYLLFNPYKGYRYLSEYQGHWNDIVPLPELPESMGVRTRPMARVRGEAFRHFQSATASTVYVLGEFPWQVRVGEQVQVADYVCPPRMLSSEGTANEVTWSLGEYTPGDAVWKGFKLRGRPPAAQGVFANQPSPFRGRLITMWQGFILLFGALIFLWVITGLLSSGKEVFRQIYSFAEADTREHAFVTPIFELKGRPSTVEVSVRTNLSNNWAFFNFALINDDTGQAWDFGREVSYYSGRDSDGSWTEGSPADSVLVPSIPAGRYYLRVEPEMDDSKDKIQLSQVQYEIRVRRDVPSYSFFWLAFPLLLLPPVFSSFRGLVFEHKRWQESDYATTSSD